MDNEDYLINMDELDQDQGPEPEQKKKRLAKLRSFLGRHLEKPLVIGISKDRQSTFTTFPKYQRPYLKKDDE